MKFNLQTTSWKQTLHQSSQLKGQNKHPMHIAAYHSHFDSFETINLLANRKINYQLRFFSLHSTRFLPLRIASFLHLHILYTVFYISVFQFKLNKFSSFMHFVSFRVITFCGHFNVHAQAICLENTNSNCAKYRHSLPSFAQFINCLLFILWLLICFVGFCLLQFKWTSAKTLYSKHMVSHTFFFLSRFVAMSNGLSSCVSCFAATEL